MNTITEDKVAQVLTTLEARITELDDTLRREREEHDATEAQMRARTIELARSNGIDMGKVGRMVDDLGWEPVPTQVRSTWTLRWSQRIPNWHSLESSPLLVVRQTGSREDPVLTWETRQPFSHEVTTAAAESCWCSEAREHTVEEFPQALRDTIAHLLESDTVTVVGTPRSCGHYACTNR